MVQMEHERASYSNASDVRDSRLQSRHTKVRFDSSVYQRIALQPRYDCCGIRRVWREPSPAKRPGPALRQRLPATVSLSAFATSPHRAPKAFLHGLCPTGLLQKPYRCSIGEPGSSMRRASTYSLPSGRYRVRTCWAQQARLRSCAGDGDQRQRSGQSARSTATSEPVSNRGTGERASKTVIKSASQVALEQFERQRGPSTPVVAAVFVAAYLAVGTTFYTVVESWSPLDALYFVVQAGLNVGYGDIQPSKEISRLFTAGFVLAGNLLLGGALALFVQGALMKQEQLIQQWAEESDASRASLYDASQVDLGAKSNASVLGWVASLFSDAVNLTQDVQKVLTSYAKRAQRRISDAAENALGGADGTAGDEPRGASLLIRDLSTVGMVFLNSPLGNVISSYSILWIWIGTGTLFGIVHEHLPFSDALLFSVSSLSTLGISPPPSSDPVSRLFCTFFLLSGVAVYALTLGRVANFFVDRYEREQVRRLVTRRLRLRATWQRATPRCDIHDNAAALAWKAQMKREHADLLESSPSREHADASETPYATSDPTPSSNGTGQEDPIADVETLTWAEFLEWKLLTEGRISIERLAAIRQEFEECFEHS